MRKFKLSRYEQSIEDAIGRGEYVPAPREEFERVAKALAERRKDKVLNIRVNGNDLEAIKKKAKKFGVKYQSFISEILHRVAQE